jgi:oxygen-independent coproporphyrinogen-3 oxidase
MGYDLLLAHGYVPVGFDHFALPGDALAKATRAGHLRRNFQGFTEDEAPALVGLGASAITSLPDVIVQNEKNAGRYRMMLSQHRMPGALGIRRDAATRELGQIIEGLLCRGTARIGAARALAMGGALAPFVERDLVQLEGEVLALAPGALPYARTIAALFDPHRQQSARRFSSAV